MDQRLSPRRRAYDLGLRLCMIFCAGVTCALLIFLIGYIFYRGAGGVTWDFLSGTTSYIRDTIGILPNILNTLYIVLLAMALVLPLGVGAAIYLTEYAANRRVVELIEFATETLTGIPSIIYGLVGMLVLVPAVRSIFHVPDGASLLAAIIVLAIMILPSIIKVSVTALDAVPKEYENASLALGASPVETFFWVSVPAAKSGIAAAVVLGVGRAIGEAMAIILVAGNVSNMPGLFTPVRFLTTGIISGMAYASVGSLYQQALYSIGLVLFLFIMLINVFLNVCVKNRKEG